MFGRHYFGGAYFGAVYFGQALGVESTATYTYLILRTADGDYPIQVTV